MKPVLPSAEDVLPRLRQMDESGWYSNFGPQTMELERRLASLLDVSPQQVVTATNATLGLEGVLATSPTSAWTVPAWTFAATVGAGLSVGKELRFVDIDPSTWWGSGEAPARILTSPFGMWREDVVETDDEVVIDAAATLGQLPSLANMGPRTAVVFSLGATKVLGSGEGGVVVFGDPERAQEFRKWTRHGFGGDRVAQSVGSNAKLSEVAAVYAHAALDNWPEERRQWRQAKAHAAQVEAAVGLEPSPASTLAPTPYWIAQFPDGSTRDLAEAILNSRGVETRRWWQSGSHTMPAHATLPRPDLPHTDDAASLYLGLPMFRGFGETEAQRVHEALSEVRETSRAW